MPNVIELVTKYLPILDEQYRLESRTAVLDTPPEFVQQTRDAKKVKIAKINVDGLADYSRSGGFVSGNMDLTWEEHEFRVDRGRALQVDALDNMETMGLAWGRLAGTFQREKVVPEMDAYRFAEYYKRAAIKKSVALTTASILETIDDIVAIQDDNEVPEEGKVLFVNPTIYKLLINDKTLTKYISVDEDMSKALNKQVYSYNGIPIIKVPSARFYTEIEMLTGGEGQEAGGYKMKVGGSPIAMMLISKAAVIQISKRVISRFWAPTRAEMDANGADGVNPAADAWKFDFRAYHDAWVLDNKTYGIAAVTASDITVTKVSISSTDISVDGSDGAHTATVSQTEHPTFQLTATVTAEGGASEAVTWASDKSEVAIVDGQGKVAVVASEGSAVITCTSVYDPTKTDKLTLTVSEGE